MKMIKKRAEIRRSKQIIGMGFAMGLYAFLLRQKV
jgi:hypothetical protein